MFLTSNRDEKHWRRPAQAPGMHAHGEHEMIYPTDGDAGGSWIALCANGNAGVLLNGAFEKHERKDRYKKSRGLVFLDVLAAKRPLHHFLKTALQDIEPFTLLLWQENNLYECRLDGKGKKYCIALKTYRPYIWSSVTLYDEAVRKKREQWFLKWLNNHPVPGRKDILDFHRFAGDGDEQNSLLMNREGRVFTVSITSLEITGQKGLVHYTDVLTRETARQQFHHAEDLTLA